MKNNMKRAERVDEITNSIKAFNKNRYTKDELLDEMFALQDEMVNIAFRGTNTETSNLKIWDIMKHFEEINDNCGNKADAELNRFEKDAKAFGNLIKAEISGRKGEAKAFSTLDRIHTENIIMKNVELGDSENRTEIDAMVITPKAMTIVEVKNTARDIFIDEEGNYYRTGEYLNWDCNIGEKIRRKEELLRQAVGSILNEDVPIKTVVVFTDNRIKVQNRYPGLRTTFACQLPCIIDSMNGETKLSGEDMAEIEKQVRMAENNKSYALKFDVVQLKCDFAAAMVALEEASTKKESFVARVIVGFRAVISMLGAGPVRKVVA